MSVTACLPGPGGGADRQSYGNGVCLFQERAVVTEQASVSLVLSAGHHHRAFAGSVHLQHHRAEGIDDRGDIGSLGAQDDEVGLGQG